MSDTDFIGPNQESLDETKGLEAAILIWEDDPLAASIKDPRTTSFAQAMISAAADKLKSSSGLIKKMIERAAAGAEDLAVAQFQGIIEVIQNADDVRATEVRIALRHSSNGTQLLIAHNGEPITCHNVLGMALPYLTTKTERIDQRGRFGIGLKTLKRIADSIAIHSAPYHFSGDQLKFEGIDAEAEIPGFYNPALDTLLVVQLKMPFEDKALIDWFETWHADGMLFLATVCRFRFCDLDGTTLIERRLSFSPWVDTGYIPTHPDILKIQFRVVEGVEDSWTVWRATTKVPENLHPAHKARNDITEISIALAKNHSPPGLFIGFRTKIPLSLSFSLDAQFDPSTSREAIIENPWNNWLLDQSCEVIANIASGLLISEPKLAWSLIPIEGESIGDINEHWLRSRFAASMRAKLEHLSQSAFVNLLKSKSRLSDIVYESEELNGLLNDADTELMMPNHNSLHSTIRDENERWRKVMSSLKVSKVLKTFELLTSLKSGIFNHKPIDWWIEAGFRLVKHHPKDGLFNNSFLLSSSNSALSCIPREKTNRPLVFEVCISDFAKHWGLFEELHPAYGASASGKEVLAWLKSNAAFTTEIDAIIELSAFAEALNSNKIEITDDELRELRDRFDEISDTKADFLGPKVGEKLLIDGHTFRAGKIFRQKVSVSESYLCKTLDGESSTWPDAAGSSPQISWISARYENVLKTNAARWSKRKRDDGTVSRGPRRFLSLLGAESAPRIIKTSNRVRWGSSTRLAHLRKLGAEQVEYDLVSPDLSQVLKDLQKTGKRNAKLRSTALFRTLNRNWERLYSHNCKVSAEHLAIKYIYKRGEVTSEWLNELRDTKWVAVGRGELVEPHFAVLRSPETESIYQTFVCDIYDKDINQDFVNKLELISDVRISDLIKRLEELRDNNQTENSAQTLQIYRAISKRCPNNIISYQTRIGEISVQELRQRFLAGEGLIYIGDGVWRRPNQLLRGMDIFHNRRDFVPSGLNCSNLWHTLDVPEPNLDDCIQFCRNLVQESYGVNLEAALMDVYRYMGKLVESVERKHREKLRSIPVYCNNGWSTKRPIYLVKDAEVREQLEIKFKHLNYWIPPCDIRDFPNLLSYLAIEELNPEITIEGNTNAALERGDQLRLRFRHAVDHLSNELARSAPDLRDRISVSWTQIKDIPLYVYGDAIKVVAKSDVLPTSGLNISLSALTLEKSSGFCFREDKIGDRDYGGKILASLFPAEFKRRIDGEWVLAWQKSCDTAAEEIRLASDEKRVEAMQEAVNSLNASPKNKITITRPKSNDKTLKPRTLKASVGPVLGATLHSGTNRKQNDSSINKRKGLKSRPPEPAIINDSTNLSAPTAYTNSDLEQRGWEILVQALNTSPDTRLTDFRKNHGVGADGVFDWKRFVEMKATARGPQTQIELSNNEFERAKERGSNFILALVSGLESGYKDEVRLIFDPINCTSIRPTNGVRLVSLLDAPAVIIHFEET